MVEDAPSWLTETFLASVIQGGKFERPKVVVKDFTVKLAVAKGNNFMSIAYRVQARYVKDQRNCGSTKKLCGETKTIDLIVKAPVTKGMVSDFQEKNNIFEIEPRVYDEVLPRINEMLGCQFNPKRLYCPLKNGMVLTDLIASGYVMCDKNRQLDFAHCEATLVALGRFHAASVLLQRAEPALVGEVGRERMCVEGGLISGEMRPWVTGGVATLGRIASALPGCQPIGKYLLDRAAKFTEALEEICKEREDRFNVLNHGDLWINNILFKHDQHGNVEDIKFIDFQVVRWASPSLDMLYFIWSSANEESRKRLPDLLSTYLTSLNGTLDKLRCDKRLSREELESEMLAASDWAILMVAAGLPILMSGEEDAVDATEMNKDDFQGDELAKKMKSLHSGKSYSAVLPAILMQLQQWLL